MKLLKTNILYILISILLANSVHAQYSFDWSSRYGGDAWDESRSVVETSSGDIVIAGVAKSKYQVMWLVKISEQGKKKWSRIFANYTIISPENIIETKDSSLIVVGYNAEHDSLPRNLWITKIDSMGTMIWEKSYAGRGNSKASSVIQTADKGYAIAGFTSYTYDDASYNCWVLKLDSLGNFQWEDEYGSPKDDRAIDLTQLPDKNIVVAGFMSYDNGTRRSIAMSKYDTLGNRLWLKEIMINKWDEATSIITTSDSCLMIGAFTRFKPLIDFDVLLIKLTPEGDTIWTSSLLVQNWEHSANVIETYDKGFAIAGSSRRGKEFQSNFLLAKFDSKGNFMWSDIFKRKSYDFVSQIIQTKDNGILMSGSTTSYGIAWDYAILKYKSTDKSDLYFLNPIDSVITFTDENIILKTCIQGYRIPKKAKIICNEKEIVTISSFNISNKKDCDFILEYNFKLNKGINKIEIQVTDYKDFQFSKFRTIYYIPPPVEIW